jgi:hypothetical protein
LAHIPVIMVTVVENRNLGYTLGVSDYLTKPVDRDRLVTVLRRHTRGARSGPVLIVEDDAAMRQLLRRMLVGEGWAVIEAENGRVGLERVAEHTPGLILLDLMMPEMDGFEFVARLREREPGSTVPVVVVTAKDLTDEDRRRLNSNVQRVIEKGAQDRDGLLQALSRLVGQYAQQSTGDGT